MHPTGTSSYLDSHQSGTCGPICVRAFRKAIETESAETLHAPSGLARRSENACVAGQFYTVPLLRQTHCAVRSAQKIIQHKIPPTECTEATMSLHELRKAQ